MAVRFIELGRVGWGSALLFAPCATLSKIHHLKIDTKTVVVGRVLGGRQLAQAALSGLDPSPEILAMGVWVDLAHSSTAFALAALDRTRVRGGIIDGLLALAFAGVGYRALLRGSGADQEHDRRRDRLARSVLGIAPGGGPLLRLARSDRQEKIVTSENGGAGRHAGTALIVGGSSGIGLASARELIDRGYRVVLMARDAARLAAVAAELGAAATAAPADLLDADAVNEVVQDIVSRYGTLEVVVHTAQVMAYGRIEDVPAQVYERTIETATHGTANLARAVLPVFRRQGRGSLIIVNSLLGHMAVPQMGTYVVSKWAQLALIRTLQLETRDAPDIHVSEISPGAINTPIYDQAANYTGHHPAPPPPVLSPAAMGRAVAKCVEKPRRHMDVGPANKIAVLGFRLTPWVFDHIVGPLSQIVVFHGSNVPPSEGNVLSPQPRGESEHGGWSLLGKRRGRG